MSRLNLWRKRDQAVIIGGGDSGMPEITVTVRNVKGGKVELSFDAPNDVPIVRDNAVVRVPRDDRRPVLSLYGGRNRD